MARNILSGLAIVLLASQSVLSEGSVGILSRYNQIITSSTLQWVAGNGNPNQLHNTVVGGFERVAGEENSANLDSGNSLYVCRASHDGVWMSGQLRHPYRECTVSLHGSVVSNNRYEILQNLEGGAMLSWMPWNKFVAVPTGAVSGGRDNYLTYVARKKTSDSPDGSAGYTHYLGKFDPKKGLGKVAVVTESNNEIEDEDGEILVETEPIRYELSNVKFILYRQHAKRVPVVLADVILRNGAGTVSMNVDSALAFNYTHEIYWGHGHGLITSLNTTVKSANGTILDNANWGMNKKEELEDVFRIERLLEPGTACNVTLRANNTEMDVPYSATLTSFYPEGKKKARNIQGTKAERGIMDVTPEYGPIYYLRNNSLVPTTTTTTTTTTSTTTTTTTTTEAPLSAEKSSQDSQSPKKKEEPITAVKNKGENQSMMSDDGDVLSLKKKDQIQKAGILGTSASVALIPSIAMTVLALCTGVRQRLL